MERGRPSERRARLDLAGAEQEQRPHDVGEGYDYRRECSCDFDQAVELVEAALARHGFTIRIMHDIQATLASKGFQIKPIRIYEVDGPGDPAVGGGPESPEARLARLMPCRINVFVEDETVVVTALRPTLLCRVFPEEGLDEVAGALERVLVAVVDDAVG
jgi:uncharacterized protein (DUF302 family)